MAVAVNEVIMNPVAELAPSVGVEISVVEVVLLEVSVVLAGEY